MPPKVMLGLVWCILPLATHSEKQEYMKLEHKEHRGPSGVS